MTRMTVYLLLLSVQALCVLFFAADIILTAVAIYPHPLSWSVREMMEIGALGRGAAGGGDDRLSGSDGDAV
jgi:hypothetical protein